MIIDILTDNPYCDSLVDRMNDYDLLNLITYYISVPKPYNITQEKLDELVEVAKKHPYTDETIWRLAMNYDGIYNLNKLEEYFVNHKDLYYLREYLYSVDNKDKDHIVNLILKTKDKEFINKIVGDSDIKELLGDKLIKKLEE